jgi:hypothetical protein
MRELKILEVEKYLKSVFGEVKLKSVSELGVAPPEVLEEGVKGFGYGKPYLITFERGGKVESAVLSSMRVQAGFGHEHFADRAQVLLWQHDTFNRLPRHVRSIDVGFFTKDGRLCSAGGAEEFFLLMEMVTGSEYVMDLERIKKKGGRISELDRRRAVALAEYLAEIHSNRHDAPELYVRKIRDLVGHGECIMGLADSYPDDLDYITPKELCEIEKKCVEWRWKIKGCVERLCMTHGDFHPYNIMFREGVDFTVLDRSRGEWGEAADDVSSLSMNYIFYALQTHGSFTGGFKELFEVFFETYLKRSGDDFLLRVIQPFFVFRTLVVASPVWYPNLSPVVREKLFNFLKNVLEVEEFIPGAVGDYLEG